MSPASPLPVSKPHAFRALGGLWRLTYPGFFAPRRLLILAGLSGLLFLLTAQNVNRAETVYFHRWAVEFYLAFLLPAVTFLAAAGAVRDDMLPVSTDYLLTRPVRRAWFVALRFICHVACTQIASLIPLAAMFAAAGTFTAPAIAAMLPRVLAAQVMVVAGFSALGFLAGSLTARYLVVGVLYGAIVEIGLGRIPVQISRLSMTHHVLALFENSIRGLPGVVEAGGLGSATLAFAAFTLVGLGATAAVFSLREFAGQATAEK